MVALAAAGAQVLIHYGRGATEADGVNIVGDRLDILAANAGISKSTTIEDTTIEDFDRRSPFNVRAPFFPSSNCFRSLRKEAVIVLVAFERSRLRVENFYADLDAVWLRCPSLPAMVFPRPTSPAW